jgi:hypothetical protein
MIDSKPDRPPGARANQGFGAPGGERERLSGKDADRPAKPGADRLDKYHDRNTDMKRPAEDGLDPKTLEKTIKSDSEMIAKEQLDEDLSVTGAPPRDENSTNGPED